ncbi:MAG: TerB family tellurite resistance protein [Polyangiaceae bacterium]
MLLLIVLGTRGVTYTTGTGELACPTCQAQTTYRARRVRRFLSLYFVPLVPLGVMGDYLECTTCLDTFDVDAAEGGEAAARRSLARFHGAVLRVMVWMMLADGEIDPEERRAIFDLYDKLTGAALGDDALSAEIAACERADASITEYLGSLVGRLNDEGKDTVLRAAICVAGADGRVDAREALLLREIGAALEVSPARQQALLAELSVAA